MENVRNSIHETAALFFIESEDVSSIISAVRVSLFHSYLYYSHIRQSSLNGNIELGRETGLLEPTIYFLCIWSMECVWSLSYIQHMLLHTFYTPCDSLTSSLKVSLPAARLQC